MDFTVKKESDPLRTIFNKAEYNTFKDELTTKIPISTSAGNVSNRFLSRMKQAENKKEIIKQIKEELAVNNDVVNHHLKHWIMKTMKLIYVTLDSSDFANEDCYLYFVLSPIFKSFLLPSSRDSLLLGESDSKT